MASTYTSSTGIEKIGTGEQAGTWGTTSNRNFDIIDTALNGVVSITLSGTTHTLTTTDGTVTDGMNKVLVLAGSPSGTNTITISPNDQEKLYFVSNGSGQSAVFSQGSGANVTIANGAQAIIYADGAGSGAAVAEIKPVASAGSIGTASIADDAVTTAKIADDAVTNDKIANDAVTNASIATNAVRSSQIFEGQVTTVKLADDAVTTAKIADDAVGADAINISGNGTAGQAVTSDGDGSFSYTTLTSATTQTFACRGGTAGVRDGGVTGGSSLGTRRTYTFTTGAAGNVSADMWGQGTTAGASASRRPVRISFQKVVFEDVPSGATVTVTAAGGRWAASSGDTTGTTIVNVSGTGYAATITVKGKGGSGIQSNSDFIPTISGAQSGKIVYPGAGFKTGSIDAGVGDSTTGASDDWFGYFDPIVAVNGGIDQVSGSQSQQGSGYAYNGRNSGAGGAANSAGGAAIVYITGAMTAD